MLMDETKRKDIDDVMGHARIMILRERARSLLSRGVMWLTFCCTAPLSILPDDLKPSDVGDDHPLVKALNPSLDDMIRSKSKEIFVEEELARRRWEAVMPDTMSPDSPSALSRKQKLSYQNEGAEAAKKDAEVNEKKRKKEAEEQWEARRDDRVQGWRTFASSGATTKSGSAPAGTKKKKKLNVLG